MPPKFVEHIVIFLFERRLSKQDSVIRLRSTFGPPNSWVGYATAATITLFGFLKTPSSNDVPSDLNLTAYIYAEKYLCFVISPN